MSPPALVLASASPRRAELLRSAGVTFAVRPVDLDERWLDGEHPLAYVERVAAGKATAAAALPELEPGSLILAADTTVWIDGEPEPLAKPRDRAHARAMLRLLTRGQAHMVTTACAFAHAGGDLVAQLTETTSVRMRELSEPAFERFIVSYLERAAWQDKAGAYAIQGCAAELVSGITGSYTAVVGLPLAQVVTKLEELRDHG